MDYKHLVLEDTAASIEAHRISPTFDFAVSGIIALPLVGDTYSNNGSTFQVVTVSLVLIRATRIIGINDPTAFGTLARVTGLGDLSISFSSRVRSYIKKMIFATDTYELTYIDSSLVSHKYNVLWDRAGTSIYPHTITDSVGIGTVTPQAMLHVEGDIVPSASGLNSLGSATRRYATLYLASTINYATDLVFNSSGTKVTIGTTGYVGIGSAAPQAMLHVEGDIVGKANSTSNLGSASRKYAALYLASKIYYSSDLEFDSSGTKVTIGTTGYVGIGTVPQAQLHVQGNIIAGSIASSGGLTFSTLTTVNVAATPYSLTPVTTRIEINNTTVGPATPILVNLQTSALAEGTVIVVYYKNDNGGKSLTLTNTQGSDWITLQGNSMLFIKTSDGWSPIVKTALN